MNYTPISFVTLSPPLNYEEAIYWLYPCYNHEMRVGRDAIKYERLDLLVRTREVLKHAAAKQARELGWHAFTTVESQWTAEYGDVFVRLATHEQPGWERIDLWRGPEESPVLRLMPQGVQVIDLPLRPLMYRGEISRAALHENVLYIVLAIVAPA